MENLKEQELRETVKKINNVLQRLEKLKVDTIELGKLTDELQTLGFRDSEYTNYYEGLKKIFHDGLKPPK